MVTFHAHFRRIGLLALAALTAWACGQQNNGKTAQTPSAQDYSAYVKAYTGGIVAPDAIIRVDLTRDVQAEELEGLFRFKPAVKGTVKQNNAASFSFVPEDGALKAGQLYAVSFALARVMPDAPERFDFGITVRGVESTPEEEEMAAAEGFSVRQASLQEDHVTVLLSEAPANAQLKGMVELQGAARHYVQVEDRMVKVHFEGRTGDLVLTLDPALKSAGGATLGTAYTRVFPLEEEKPAVQIPLTGSILPDKDRLILPFRAVNLGAVEVRIVKIYEKNVLMFLQDNDLGGNSGLRRSGRLVYRGDIPLDASKDLHKWNTHSIDLGGLVKQEPGAIYRIRLSFRQDQSLYGGKEYMMSTTAPSGKPSAEDEATWDIPYEYYWDNDYDWERYNWEEADDPSKPSYYMDSDRFPAIQLIGSDLGLLAEYAGGNTLWAVTTDLLNPGPVPGASLEVYDYQLQPVGKGKTDSNGLAEIAVARKPFAVVAKAGGSVAYLKVTDGNERSTSRFDVGGEVLKQGLKGFAYGERGVWRPGDVLHLTLILSDKGKALPEGHPVNLDIYTPEGQFYTRLTRKGTDGFYSFDVPTRADDPTGYWNAYFKVGGSTFHKILHIETVKPNRLKINTSFGESALQAGSKLQVKTRASWLSGGVAGDLPVNAQMTLRRLKGSPFKGFEKYSFNDPSSNFSQADFELYKGKLDSNGDLAAAVTLPAAENAPGMLQAFIVTSVQEAGGDESFTTETLPYSPYSAYVGIRVPDGDYLETDKDHNISLAVVNADGKRVAGHQLEYAVFKTGWNWWWDNPGGELDAYVSGPSVTRLTGGTLKSGQQDVSFTLREDYPAWGNYLILVRDKTSGHVSGRTVTLDWPDYRGRAGRRDPEALSMLSFSTDKAAYEAGEKATVYIPAAPGGRALVSLENSAGVLRREWVATGSQDTPWSFTIEPAMAPNIYVSITLLQPYGATSNDLPLRLYGVQRVKVENPASHLNPVIQLPSVLHPEEEFTVKVSEKSGKPMTYTLAIVDEGLLDLTAFKTPDPWNALYKNEALSVKTWDLYDQVIGAWGGKLSPLAAIGGDEDAIRQARKDNRFNPVVLFLPPKTLAKGTDVLKLKLPMYVGSVRVMVVAGHEGAYGSADATVPVQNPLMVVTTLPRVLGTGESLAVPVNVFAMEDGVKEATVTLKVDGPVSLEGTASQNVKFTGKGDQLVYFQVKSGDKEGVAHFSVQASGSGQKAAEELALDVRNAQPPVASVERFTLAAGEQFTPARTEGSVQLAAFPALDARKLYLDMRNYPYECAEQLSARGITLLELLPLLDESDAADTRSRLAVLVSKLYARQNSDGGFAYWSGGKSDSWVSSMAGHFLSEASKAGFEVNAGVVKAWKDYQMRLAQQYRAAGSSEFENLDQAWRLYTLAAAGSSYASGMNRLRESGDIGSRARWMLAASYALAGKAQTAEAVLEGVGKDFPEYEPYNITYGSSLRDRMIALDALVLTGRVNDALAMAGSLPARSLSTQESAFTAIAYRHLFDKVPTSGIKAQMGRADISSTGSLVCVPVSAAVRNTGEGPLYGSWVTESSAPLKQAVSNGLKLEVKYLDENGLAVNPSSLQQGTRFKAVVKVSAGVRALENLALSVRIPSGWEIVNERLVSGAGEDGYDHKDIRDDRVNWFFGLPAGRYKTFTVQLRAAYEGSYFLPSVVCEAMYEPGVNAATASGTAMVVR